MKQPLLKHLLLLALLLATALSATAYSFEVDGIYYDYDEDELVASVTKGSYDGNSYSGDVIIPSSVTYDGVTYKVTEIGSYAFEACVNLTSVSLPNSITRIGQNAFYGSSLESIYIPSSVTSLGNFCFIECSSLTSVVIPSSITSIPMGAFASCTSLTSVTLPYGIKSVGLQAFIGCTNLSSINLPNSLTIINKGAFERCKNLKEIVLPESLTKLYKEAFASCTSLTSITIPSGVTVVGDYAFSNCTGLKSVDIQNSIIGNFMFSGCSSLTSVTIGENVTSIGASAFKDCSGLTSIAIPNSVSSIGEYAFMGCSGLTSMTIGKNVTSIGSGAFSNCSALESISVDSGNTYFNSIDGVLFNKDLTSLIQYPKGKEDLNYTIPTSVTTICKSAFYGCSNLSSVSISNNVSLIDTLAFSYCTGLTTISLPNNISTIYTSTFSGCTGLTSVEIPSSVTIIGSSSFSSCTGLTSVIIPGSVTTIEKNAFYSCSGLTSLILGESVSKIDGYAFYKCINLVSVRCKAATPPTLNGSGFSSETYDTATLYVPEASLQSYQTADYWEKFSTIEIDKNLVETLSLDSGKLSLYVGSTAQLTASTTPSDAANPTLTWTSSNTSVATVDANGSVTAIATGTAIITVATTDGSNLSATCTVTVKAIPVSAITLSATSLGMNVNETAILTATVAPTNATNSKVTWSSSNTSVAIVTSAGKVTAVGEGKATITVTAADGSGTKATCLVTVTAIKAESISLSDKSLTMMIDETATLTATILPENVTNNTINWSTNNSNVATVDANGLVTAKAIGTATITAATTDGSGLTATCLVTVRTLTTDEYFSMDDMTVLHGDTITIPVKMVNTSELTAFQTDIFLPDELTLLTDEDGEYLIEASSRMHRTHTIMSNAVSNGSVRVLCYSPSNKTFSGNEGDLFYLTVKVADDAEGEYTIQLKNTLLTTTNVEELSVADASAKITVNAYTLGDANASGTVTIADIVVTARNILELDSNSFVFDAADVNKDGIITITDIVAIANLILNPTLKAPMRAPMLENSYAKMYGSDLTLLQGETQMVSIALDNEAAFTAFQLDLRLPEGLTATNFRLSNRASGHTLMHNTLSNGDTRVLCYTPTLATIDDTEGVLLTFDVTAQSIVFGDILVDGIEAVTSDCRTALLNSFTIGVNSATSVNELNGSNASDVVETIYYNLQGMQLGSERPTDTGVYLQVTRHTNGTTTANKFIIK